MKDMILELKCNDCRRNDKINQYETYLTDSLGKKYYFIIHDIIPKHTVIRINTYHHELKENNDLIKISVKQKFENNQPSQLELEIIEIFSLTDGVIVTLKDTTTNEIFKLKVDSSNKNIGFIDTINLKELNMIIRSMPHFYDKYVIENWLYFSNIIESL